MDVIFGFPIDEVGFGVEWRLALGPMRAGDAAALLQAEEEIDRRPAIWAAESQAPLLAI